MTQATCNSLYEFLVNKNVKGTRTIAPIPPFILNLDIRQRCVLNITHWPLYHREKKILVPSE
jgi:hypothetical protein